MILTNKMKTKINQGLNSYIKQNFGSLNLVPKTLIPLRFEYVNMTEIGLCETEKYYTFKGKAKAVYAIGEDEITSDLSLEGKVYIEEDKQNDLVITILGNVCLQKTPL